MCVWGGGLGPGMSGWVQRGTCIGKYENHGHSTPLLLPHITPPSLTPDIIRLSSPRDGQTALHRAANSDQHEIVSLLLTEDPLCANIQDKNGNTALHLACHKAHKRTVNTLLVRTLEKFENIVDSSCEMLLFTLLPFRASPV